MIFNPFYYPCLYPAFPNSLEKPPTLYSIMNSMVNFEVEEPTKIKDLAKATRTKIFNFEYPLSNNISRETFETMILNKFLMRRIGYETFTAWQIQLNVKLNEIMPMYNKMFDAIEKWDIFNDGETTTRTGTDNKTSNSENNSNTTNTNTSNTQSTNTASNTNNTQSTNTASNTLNNESTTNTNTLSDRRNSELPQNQLENVRDGSYVTNYNYDTNTNTGNDTSKSNGSSESNSTNTVEENRKETMQNTVEENRKETMQNTNNTIDNNTYNETIKRSPTDKIAILREMQENIKSIYTMIFKDLDCLFYQLI